MKQQVWYVGDRFIFVKKTIKSEAVALGYKGTVQFVFDGWVSCDGWAFEFDEIKKLVTVRQDGQPYILNKA